MALSSQRQEDIANLLRPFRLEEHTLVELASAFSLKFSDLARSSDNQFIPTPVSRLPTGREEGNYLALDIGGSNLRVGIVRLLGDQNEENGWKRLPLLQPIEGNGKRAQKIMEKSWPIEDHLKSDQTEMLFEWLGTCIAEVVADVVALMIRSGADVPYEMATGVTFSFPMIQESITEATLMPMGKGFAISSKVKLDAFLLAGYEKAIEGVSLAHFLKNGAYEIPDATEIRLPSMKIVAIINDSVATLASLAYSISAGGDQAAMALIVGTGTNATIPTPASKLGPAKATRAGSSLGESGNDPMIVVNTEWSIKGTAQPLHDLSIVTAWDEVVSQGSESPGFQPLEYMTSGRYLGEICRLVLLETFVVRLGYSEEQLPLLFRRRYALTSTFLTHLLCQPDKGVSELHDQLSAGPAIEGSPWQWTDVHLGLVRSVAWPVSNRSAAIIAAATIGLLSSTGVVAFDSSADAMKARRKPHSGEANGGEILVAATGGVISQFPAYTTTCQEYINSLTKYCCLESSGVQVTLREVLDGGILGAGVLAGTFST
ncbi:MAG: hypothetical protein M1825_004369 [Sarcosagium campestre]|nr:MAG: hypothetical protein M1825_004369 [Sarcosagium campestre]